jgi:capsular polysaccharide transport system permease protein
MFFISGVFFSMRDIPKDYWWLLDWNPLLHAIELSRYSSYTTYGTTGVSFTYLWTLTLLSLFFSLLFYRAFWKKGVSR